MISQLSNTIQAYAWGSHTALAKLRGETEPTLRPEAELWMGAHPLAPSHLATSGESLLSAISANPAEHLGAGPASHFGGKLPFLLKVLSAASPLSLQAHPSIAQARRGFAEDEAANIPLDAPNRNYKDENHKPELLCALGEFWALCGFREVASTLRLLDELGLAELATHRAALAESPDHLGISQVFSALMQAPAPQQRLLSQLTTAACLSRSDHSAEFSAELRWAARLGELYPGDIGVVSALLLNLVRLEPGEALYLPAGNLHAYLAGTGIELMASSDNVLRGGLTPKHVNVPELLRVLDFSPLRAEPLRPIAQGDEHTYSTTAREFELSYFDLADTSAIVAVEGPEIWLVVTGSVTLSGPQGAALQLTRAQSAFVSAATRELHLNGNGRIFRAKVAHWP